jgi:hypothetical protein
VPALSSPPRSRTSNSYPWLSSSDTTTRALVDAFPPPEGYARVAVGESSFGAWLRTLPLRAAGREVRDYRGHPILEAHHPHLAAVAEIDIGHRDLQQCADSIIRLHAEWLWSKGRKQDIAYHFTSGDLAAWSKYAHGHRASIVQKKVVWKRSGRKNESYENFQDYLKLVFTYAGTVSLMREAKPVERADIQPGDFFVTGGSPGHTVLVLDMATHGSGAKVALLGQGFMPAQDFHVLATGPGQAWFSLEEESVETPFWSPFPWHTLRRF